MDVIMTIFYFSQNRFEPNKFTSFLLFGRLNTPCSYWVPSLFLTRLQRNLEHLPEKLLSEDRRIGIWTSRGREFNSSLHECFNIDVYALWKRVTANNLSEYNVK